jgi:EpsI family protein
MVPIWSVPVNYLQDPSRIVSATIAVTILQFTGLPVLQEGTNILLPSHTLAVLRECSGVNQLIALTAMVLPATYLWLNSIGRRVALIVLAVVISYLGNGFRIAMVGWLAAKGFGDGDINGSGPIHLLQGLGVSALGYLAIGGCFSLLSTSKSVTRQRPDNGAPAGQASIFPALTGRRLWIDAAVLLVMLGAGTSRLYASHSVVQLNEELGSLENQIGSWTMELGPPSMAVRLPMIDDDLVNVGAYPSLTGARRFLAVDDELVRVYRSATGNRVQLYIGYYHRQQDGKELTGDAGTALARAASSLTLTTESGPVALNEIVHQTAGTRRGVLFWYDVNGRIVSDFYRLKSYMVWDAVTRQRTNGAVVMIAWDGPAGAASEAARQGALDFARAVMPVLRRYLPS